MAPKKKAPQTHPALPEGDEGVTDPPVSNPSSPFEDPTNENPHEEDPVLTKREVTHTKETNDIKHEALMAEKEVVDLLAKVVQAKEDAAKRQREEETNAEAERYHERK